jgi:hypothetical protein
MPKICGSICFQGQEISVAIGANGVMGEKCKNLVQLLLAITGA